MEALAFHSFLQFQTHINSPSLSQLSLKFAVANSYWLIQQILAGSDYSEKKHRELKYDTLPKDEVRLLPFKTFLYVTAQEQTHVLFSFFPFLFQLFFVDLFQFIRKIDGAYFRSEWLQFFFWKYMPRFRVLYMKTDLQKQPPGSILRTPMPKCDFN